MVRMVTRLSYLTFDGCLGLRAGKDVGSTSGISAGLV